MSNKIKILHFLPTLNFGGAEKNLLSLLDHFDHETYEHHLVYTNGGDLEGEFKPKNVILKKIMDRRINLKNPVNLLLIIKVISYIKRNEIDLLHCHLDLTNLYGVPAAKFCHIPVVLHFHGHGISTQGLEIPLKGYRFWKWTGMLLYPLADCFIVIIRKQIEYLDKIGIDKKRIYYIPNGYAVKPPDIEVLKKAEHEFQRSSGMRFISVGTMYRAKNHTLLIHAFGEIQKLSPQSQLILIGDGPLRKDLENLAGELKLLPPQIYFMGKRSDVIEILSLCDCFILPSLWELHPVTILEAMSVGLPVIATDVGGVSDTVIDSETGFLVPPNDEKALTEAMLRILRDREKGRLMGLRGKETVDKRFSQRQAAEAIERVYWKALHDGEHDLNILNARDRYL